MPVQINGKMIKSVMIPDHLSSTQEYEFLYAALYNDMDIRALVGLSLKKVVHVPRKLVNLITKEN